MKPIDGLVTVVECRHDGPLAWEVLAGPDGRGGLATAVRRFSGSHKATSGFAGPPMWPGGSVNWWTGSATGLPDFVLARTLPVVARLAAFGAGAAVIQVSLSEVDARFGLRFGAAPLPPGFGLHKLKATLITGPVIEIPVPARLHH